MVYEHGEHVVYEHAWGRVLEVWACEVWMCFFEAFFFENMSSNLALLNSYFFKIFLKLLILILKIEI